MLQKYPPVRIAGKFRFFNFDFSRTYPNPAKELVTVNVGNSSLAKNAALTDIHGKLLQTIRISSLSFTINMAGYPAGVYLLRMENERPVKIVKE